MRLEVHTVYPKNIDWFFETWLDGLRYLSGGLPPLWELLSLTLWCMYNYLRHNKCGYG